MIVCNGRCLDKPHTGIQRYTREILQRLPEVSLVRPPESLGVGLGFAWEQLLLPGLVKGNLLWNPANTGPMLGTVPQVVTVHDLATLNGVDSASRPARRWLYKWMLPTLLHKARGVLTVSEFSRQQIIEACRLSADRIAAIPLGVDHTIFFPRPRDEVVSLRGRLALDEPYVLTVGSGSARKNLRTLIEAWPIAVAEIGTDVELIITGDAAAYGRAFDGTRVPPLPPRSRLVGRLSDADLAVLMSGAAAFVFPSLFEGFGLPPLEAMAAGSPCIVSNTTSLPEVVGNAALLIDPTDKEAIADAIASILNNREIRDNLRTAGIVRAASFRWDETARRTIEFLRSRC